MQQQQQKVMVMTEQRTRVSHRNLALRELLRTNSIQVHFQPIVDMHSTVVFGYEALARPVLNPELFPTLEELFHYARTAGLLIQLERLCLVNALKAARLHSLHDRYLFLNSSVMSLQDPELGANDLFQIVTLLGLTPARIVLEITERERIENWDGFRGTLREYRRLGFQVAVDDLGAGYHSLKSLVEVQPDVVKFDAALIRSVHRDIIRLGIVEALSSFSKRLGCLIIAEGVENEDEHHKLRDLGIPYGQGYYFARPSLIPVAS